MEYGASTNEEEYALWLRFKGGDRDAFAQIYERYVGILYNYGYHILPDAALIKDAIQELFANLWYSRSNLSPTTSIKYYLFRSLRRQINRLKEKEQRYEPLENSEMNTLATPSYSPEMQLIESETVDEKIRLLQQALSKLPARQNEAIRLRFFEGFELHEVASIMQMNEQSVRNLIQRSIRKMRQVFDFLAMLLTFFCM